MYLFSITQSVATPKFSNLCASINYALRSWLPATNQYVCVHIHMHMYAYTISYLLTNFFQVSHFWQRRPQANACRAIVTSLIFYDDIWNEQFTYNTFRWALFCNNSLLWYSTLCVLSFPLNFYCAISICCAWEMSSKWISCCCVDRLLCDLWSWC